MQNKGCTEKQQAVGTFSTRIPYNNADASPMLIFRAWATCDSTPFIVFFLHCRSVLNSLGPGCALGQKEKKVGERSEPRGSLMGGKGWRRLRRPFPLPRPPLGSLRSPKFFPFSPLRSLHRPTLGP